MFLKFNSVVHMTYHLPTICIGQNKIVGKLVNSDFAGFFYRCRRIARILVIVLFSYLL